MSENARKRNVILIGFMGCGKSTVGARLAEMLDFRFVDTDSIIEERAGKKIPDIFSEVGEEGFRELESQALQSAAESTFQVISTGGGIVTVPENGSLLESAGFVVWLSADAETIASRVVGSDRPLLKTDDPVETIRELLAARQPLYSNVAHLEVDSHDLRPDDIAYGICESARHFFACDGD